MPAVVAVFGLLLIACAPSLREPPIAPTPQQIPALRAFFANDTANVAMRMRLAEAERRGGLLTEAALLLEPVAESTPVAGFYLALVREDQGRAADARRLYERYLVRRPTGDLSDKVRQHLTQLGNLEQQETARTVVARERELSTQTPPADVVAVFPFLPPAVDAQYHPLGTAFAELLSNDLAQTTKLRVVERARVQRMLDEIKVTDAQRVDPTIAVRVGRLLGAGMLVQGRIEGSSSDASYQAVLVRAQTPATAGSPVVERDAFSGLVDAEKRVVLGIFTRLGIQLTPAERERVMRPATHNVQALVEFGLGLELQGAGRFADAAIHFDRAVIYDGAFALARQRPTETTTQGRTATSSTNALADMAGSQIPTERLASLQAANPFQAVERLVPNPLVRDASAEAFGAEGFGRSGEVDVVIQRPAGTGTGSSNARSAP